MAAPIPRRLGHWHFPFCGLKQSEFDRLTRNDDWEPTQAQWARMSEDQREAMREHSKLLKVNEDTRFRRLQNDIKEGRMVDTADLKEASSALFADLNKHIDEIVGVKIPRACFGRDSQTETNEAARPFHLELKEALREVCRKFGVN